MALSSETSPAATTCSSRYARSSTMVLLILGSVTVVALVALRTISELGMMRLHEPDPQMPIWYMELAVKLGFWIVLGVIPLVIIIAWRSRWRVFVGPTLLLLWAVMICLASWNYRRSAQALLDAANPSTSGDRLVELVDFNGLKAGYELDNRIASHPKTPATALRRLYERNNSGTLMCLARNPNTPADILAKLAQEEDELIQQSLSKNPQYRPIRQGLDLLSSTMKGEQSEDITLTVIDANQHLGHNLTESGGHSVWIDACRGRLNGTDEEFVIWWNAGEIRDYPFKFEKGKTYKISFQGDVEDGVMGFEGKCLHVGKVKSVEQPAGKL